MFNDKDAARQPNIKYLKIYINDYEAEQKGPRTKNKKYYLSTELEFLMFSGKLIADVAGLHHLSKVHHMDLTNVICLKSIISAISTE